MLDITELKQNFLRQVHMSKSPWLNKFCLPLEHGQQVEHCTISTYRELIGQERRKTKDTLVLHKIDACSLLHAKTRQIYDITL